MDLCINESHLCPLETFDPKVEDFLYSTDMVTYLDDHLQPNELPLDNKESVYTRTRMHNKNTRKFINS